MVWDGLTLSSLLSLPWLNNLAAASLSFPCLASALWPWALGLEPMSPEPRRPWWTHLWTALPECLDLIISSIAGVLLTWSQKHIIMSLAAGRGLHVSWWRGSAWAAASTGMETEQEAHTGRKEGWPGLSCAFRHADGGWSQWVPCWHLWIMKFCYYGKKYLR